MVLNGPQAINSADNSVEVLDRSGEVIANNFRRERGCGEGVVRADRKKINRLKIRLFLLRRAYSIRRF